MDATLPLMEQVYEASTLDEALERERLTAALEEAANEFRRYSKRFAAGAQKETAAIFDLYSHLLSDARLRRELFAEVDKGSVAEWAVKKVIEKFAEQFAVLTDGYLKERAGDLRALGQRLLFHLDDTIQGRTPGRTGLCWWPMNSQRRRWLNYRRTGWRAWWCAMALLTPMPPLWCARSVFRP